MQRVDQLPHNNHDKSSVDISSSDAANVATAAGNFAMDQSDMDKEEKASSQFNELGSELIEDEREELESGIDSALDQCFFCLYGLNLRSDSSYEDDVVLHKNSSRGDYQTKEQCADVFQYILPYAKASSVSGFSVPLLLIFPVSLYFPCLLNLIFAEGMHWLLPFRPPFDCKYFCVAANWTDKAPESIKSHTQTLSTTTR